jgi:hypothetical protein
METIKILFYSYVIEYRRPRVERFEERSGQTKDYEMGMCCFSAKHAALRRKA